MNYSEIIDKVADELNLPSELVNKTYKAYWTSVRNIIQSLPLKDNLSEQQFQELKTGFNIPCLGKLHCTYERYKGVKKRFSYLNNNRK